MFRSTILRAINSLEFIAIVVILAMLLTTLTSSAQAERDEHVRQESLNYSHLLTVDRTPPSPLRNAH
jgi:hypothetical protein